MLYILQHACCVAWCRVLGSLYQHYPGFENRMREALRLLLGEEVEKLAVMGLVKDGSEVGGAHSRKYSSFL
jgi:hexokinase